MSAVLFCFFYFLLFSVIILKSAWFKAGRFRNKHFLLVFYLKLLFGTGLWLLYTHYYKNRATSDIFKYYDDANMIFATLHTSVKDYFSLITGIGDSDNRYQAIYHTMNSWDNGYNSILYNNSHFIIRLNAFFLLFSHGHYGVHVIFMCFISLIGLMYIYKAFLPFLAERSKELFAAIFLFPSVILWSSGILKEGLVWFALGLIIYHFFQLINIPVTSKNLISYLLSLIYVLFGFLILFEVKAYVLLCLLPGLVTQLLITKINLVGRFPILSYLLVLTLYILPASFPGVFNLPYNPLQMLSDKQTDFNRISRGGIYLANVKDSADYAFVPVADSVNIIPLNAWSDSLLHKRGIQYLVSNPFVFNETKTNRKAAFMLRNGTPFSRITLGNKDTVHTTSTDSTAYWIYIYIETANSRIYIEPIKPRLSSLVAHILQALNVSMLLPYPWQLHSAMISIYCAENIFVLILFIIALFFIKRPLLHKDIALFCLSYCLAMLVLIGLVTPILGGIERYKSVVIPFMFILLLLITDKPMAKTNH